MWLPAARTAATAGAAATSSLKWTMDFRYKRKYVAGNGADGQGKRCSGRVGQSLHIRVPRGTLLRDADSGAIMHDMSSGEPFVAARGGRGGWGNVHFATPTRQACRARATRSCSS